MSQHQQPPLIQPSQCHIHTLLTFWHIHRQCLVTQTTLFPMIQPILVTCTYKPIIPNSTQHIPCVILL